MSFSSVAAVAFALVGALLFALAAVFQQEEAAAQPPETAMRVGLMLRLIRNRRWLLGFACDWTGYAAEATALGFGAIVVVAPLMQTGLLFALFLGARRTGRPLARPDWIVAVALVAGLATFLIMSNPSGGIAQPSWAAWWPWLLVLGVGTGASLLVGRFARGAGRAVAWGLAAALCYGATGPLTKTGVELLSAGRFGALFSSWELYLLIACAVLGMLCNQSAFQAGNLPASLPIIAIGTPVFASAIGISVYDERLAAHGALDITLIVISVVVMVGSIYTLARRDALRSAAQSTVTTSS